MSKPPELGSDAFARWWPHLVGLFGMGLIVTDSIIFPPPDTLTMSTGTACIVGFGAIKLIRFDKHAHD